MALNESSEKKLVGVKPDLVRVCRRAAEISTQPFQIVQGNRTQAEQNALYAQGRTKPGQVVTWTKNSKHIGGGAIDFAALVEGRINWQEKYYPPIAAAFKKAASEAGIGIAWGGDWKTKDWGHIELIASASSAPVAEPKPRQTLKRGMSGGDVPVLQLRLKELGYYQSTVGTAFGPKTYAAVIAFQKASGLAQDGVVGPKTWEALNKAVRPPVAPTADVPVIPLPYNPMDAVKYFQSVGWSDLASVCLVASLMWESGGNTKKPPTIIFDAQGDRDKDGIPRSHGAGQWNETAGRYKALLDYAFGVQKPWTDPQTQLQFLNRELLTTEKRAASALRNATTIEEAMDAAIKLWRPSVPHAEKRLAIAKMLYAKLTG